MARPRMILFLVVTMLSVSHQVLTKKVLLVPWNFQSHVIQFLTVGEALQDQGHEVHAVLGPSLPSLEKVKASGINVILYEEADPEFYTQQSSDESITESMLHFLDITVKEDLRTSIKGFREMCTNPLKDKRLFKTLENLKFDLAIVDTFPMYRCLLVLMHRLGLPYVSLVTFHELWLLRNPSLPSYTPFILADRPQSTKMDFWQRLENLWSIIDWTAFPGIEYMEDSYLKQYFYETTPVPISKLCGQSLLWLIDQTPLMDYPAITMPNEIHVGGLTTNPAKPLSEDLERFMSSNPHGNIVVSFGSMGNGLPQWILNELLSAFMLVKYNVIMRYPVDRGVADMPANIKLMSWLPQNDLLGHNNTKLFITHCGANSQTESLYHGVPMIGFPMFAEQHYNAKRAHYHGFGLTMDLRTFKARQLAENIQEVIRNPSYGSKIKVASAIFRDQPMKPRDKAVYWIEHVMKYGGDHLHSHALDMVWYEYLMLDIFAFVTFVSMAVLGFSIAFLRAVSSTFFVRNTSQKQKVQ